MVLVIILGSLRSGLLLGGIGLLCGRWRLFRAIFIRTAGGILRHRRCRHLARLLKLPIEFVEFSGQGFRQLFEGGVFGLLLRRFRASRGRRLCFLQLFPGLFETPRSLLLLHDGLFGLPLLQGFGGIAQSLLGLHPWKRRLFASQLLGLFGELPLLASQLTQAVAEFLLLFGRGVFRECLRGFFVQLLLLCRQTFELLRKVGSLLVALGEAGFAEFRGQIGLFPGLLLCLSFRGGRDGWSFSGFFVRRRVPQRMLQLGELFGKLLLCLDGLGQILRFQCIAGSLGGLHRFDQFFFLIERVLLQQLLGLILLTAGQLLELTWIDGFPRVGLGTLLPQLFRELSRLILNRCQGLFGPFQPVLGCAEILGKRLQMLGGLLESRTCLVRPAGQLVGSPIEGIEDIGLNPFLSGRRFQVRGGLHQAGNAFGDLFLLSGKFLCLLLAQGLLLAWHRLLEFTGGFLGGPLLLVQGFPLGGQLLGPVGQRAGLFGQLTCGGGGIGG